MFKKKDITEMEFNVFHLEGLPNVMGYSKCRVTADDNFIIIEQFKGLIKLKVANTFKISNDKIIEVKSFSSDRVKTPAGTPLKGRQFLMSISYYNKDNQINKLVFNTVHDEIKAVNFVKAYNESHSKAVTKNEDGEILL